MEKDNPFSKILEDLESEISEVVEIASGIKYCEIEVENAWCLVNTKEACAKCLIMRLITLYKEYQEEYIKEKVTTLPIYTGQTKYLEIIKSHLGVC